MPASTTPSSGPQGGTTSCPGCGKLFKRLATHMARKPACHDSPRQNTANAERTTQPTHQVSSIEIGAQAAPSEDNIPPSLGALPNATRPRWRPALRVAQARYLQPAGTPIRVHPTPFEIRRAEQKFRAQQPWAPFASEEEWKFAQWLQHSGASQAKIDELLKSRMYRDCMDANPEKYSSFHNKESFFEVIDHLPGPRAQWKLIEIMFEGNELDTCGKPKKESVDVWARDPVEVIADLMANPAFKDHMAYAPVEKFEEHEPVNPSPTDRPDDHDDEEDGDFVIDEMWTTDWWRRVQALLPPGATVVPVILTSDKTQLSTFSGDKQAWPVYLSIGNISKDIRRQPSQCATVLLGYLPVTKLECFRKSDRSTQGNRLFHFAMRQLLEPLVKAGTDGVEMTCLDGFVHRIYPLLAAYLADFPEQCLITCTKQNQCTICQVHTDRRGELLESVYRDPQTTLDQLAQTPQSKESDLRDVPHPFWADLPLVNIFGCMTPDLLHQLHKGVFKDHLVAWASHEHEAEVDARFSHIPPYPGLRLFHRGISHISQWTGNEYHQMEKVFVGIICGVRDDSHLVRATRAILDFIYLTHYPSHTTSTLDVMKDALKEFHDNKST
ncbi:hypothetical protein OF83DRAFT_1171609 [Amylostereum chailletii]|nr:hypothetical protein OF83DRAFT_1171609 [Amylostereum chailletii]